MYKVYGMLRNRTMRVVWMLEELGADYELVEAAPRTDEVRALNASGKVPVLKDGDLIVTDSVAICQYLADKHGALTHPAGAPDRAKQDAITQFAVDQVEGAIWTAAKHKFALPEDYRVPEMRRTSEYEFDLALQHLGDKLGEGPYAVGEKFTVPDVLLGHCASWAEKSKFELPRSGKVADYFEAVRARPALQRLMATAS